MALHYHGNALGSANRAGHARPLRTLAKSFARTFTAWSTSFLGDDVGRQESQHGVVRAVDEQAFGHGVQDQLFAGNGHSIPSIRPKPRTSLTKGCLRARSF